jgi:hypothetical protein
MIPLILLGKVLQRYFHALVDNTAFAKKHQQAFLALLSRIGFIFIPSNDVKKCQQCQQAFLAPLLGKVFNLGSIDNFM